MRSLPHIKREQYRLFAEPLGNHGTVRTTLGDFAETMVAKLIGGRRYRTDSTALYCPDIVVRGYTIDKYFEVKSVGRTRESLIYAGRLVKDSVFAETNELYYVFCCHSVDSKMCSDDFELKCMFLATLDKIIIAPFESVYTAAKMSDVTPLNTNYGWSNGSKLYGSGYRLPIKRLLQFPHLKLAISRSEELF